MHHGTVSYQVYEVNACLKEIYNTSLNEGYNIIPYFAEIFPMCMIKTP